MDTFRIKKGFNILLYFYFLFDSFVIYIFKPNGDRKVPWDIVYDWSPLFAIIGAILIFLVLSLVGAAVARAFWNRFAADIFNVRQITFDEALSIVLITAIVSN